MKICECDDSLVYRCLTCDYVHIVKPERDTCLAGRSMSYDGCQGTEFDQGEYWLSPSEPEGYNRWERGVYHWVSVAKGQNKHEAKAEFAAKLARP